MREKKLNSLVFYQCCFYFILFEILFVFEFRYDTNMKMTQFLNLPMSLKFSHVVRMGEITKKSQNQFQLILSEM